MARPPLDLGTHGSISVKIHPRRAGVDLAHTRFRDFDGVTRQIKRVGPTKTAAMTALQDDLKGRMGSPPSRCVLPTPSRGQLRCGWRSWTLRWRRGREPRRPRTPTGSGATRSSCPRWASGVSREVTAGRLDAFFAGLVPAHGAQSRKTVRTVVSQILGLAVKHEALRDNPVRHLDPIEGGSKPPARSQPRNAADSWRGWPGSRTTWRRSRSSRSPATSSATASRAWTATAVRPRRRCGSSRSHSSSSRCSSSARSTARRRPSSPPRAGTARDGRTRTPCRPTSATPARPPG